MTPLIEDIEAFCRAQSLSEAQFGVLALNDKNFVPQLREGRDIRVSTAEKVRRFMVTFRPESQAA